MSIVAMVQKKAEAKRQPLLAPDTEISHTPYG